MTRRTLGAVLAVSVTSMLGLTAPAGAAAPASLDEAVSAAMITARADDAVAAYGRAARTALEPPLVEPKRSAAGGDWVFGGSVFLVPDGVEATPVTSLFFAERAADGSWRVALDGEREFTRLAGEAPEELFVDDGERAALAATGAGRPTGLALPWKKGQGGWLHSGVHGTLSEDGIVQNAVDFYGGDGLVRASAGGYLYRFCTTVNPYLQVRHPGGLTTGYYHQTELTDVPDGSWVDAYHLIGRIAQELPCGGNSNRPHVHWALLDHDGNEIPVDGRTVGGWTWHEEPGVNYAGYGERHGRELYEHECCLTNHGAGR